MPNPLRSLFLHWHRWRGTRVVLRDGVRISTDPGTTPKLVRSLLFKNTYEAAERTLLPRVVRAGDCVLDIGGGIGLVGLLAARLVGPEGRVVSYEANPGLEPMIRANYALNPSAPELRMRAVTPDGAAVTFHVADNLVSSSLHAREAATRAITVDSDALDPVIADLQPDVLVMDVEGAEVDLLPAAHLRGLRALVLELHPHVVGAEAISALTAALAAKGFTRTGALDANEIWERR
ncbi:MAG: FkbM family methyltransferase [Pseudomonadota bacterium]